ncbi:glycosyltransferase [Galactobacter sp.]|uniref:glycosyltransferase n=1 Tax=Galactobacter sp. TaxID=2676125 RepID=UPI0025C2F4BC|nr:glycosyltransferase [Galactobacter sp.]
MPRLSVLMPAFNAQDTVMAAVRSTLRDLPKDSEVVVLDDGSADSTARVLGEVKDRRLRVLSRANDGVASGLNVLLGQTDSEYIARMDADDLVLPGRFRRQLAAVDQGTDAVFSTVVTWGNGRVTPPRPSGIRPEDFGMHLLLTNPVAHSTLLARREAVAAVSGYRKLPTEDYDLWLRMSIAGSKLQRLPVPGLAYRTHPQQITASAQWRRSSWENPQIAEAFSSLAQELLGVPAFRITALAIAETMSAEEKLCRFDEFAAAFDAALTQHGDSAQRALRRKLAERRRWLTHKVAEAAPDEMSRTRPPGPDTVRTSTAGPVSTGSDSAGPDATGTCPTEDLPVEVGSVPGSTARERFRVAVAADRLANIAYPKSRLVLRWFRSAQRWRQTPGPFGRVMFLAVGGSYKAVTEGMLGMELPVSTEVGPGLRLRHGFGIVVNPSSRIGANVMLRHGVTLGNRKEKNDCPVIEDGAEIGVGAVVIGSVTVGTGAKLGPNVVVVKDVPAGASVHSAGNEINIGREKKHTNGTGWAGTAA